MFRPRGFSPPRRVAPRDGFECVATRASQGSLRFRCHRPPPPGKPDPEARIPRAEARWSARTEVLAETPFPQRGHPSKNLPRRQAVMHHCTPDSLLRLPPSRCRPEGLSLLLGPLQGVAPSATLNCPPPRCRFLAQFASFHGFLCLQRFTGRSRFHLQSVT